MTESTESGRRPLRPYLGLLALIASAVVLVLPASSSAWHDGSYWFFRGYLPKSDGTRSVFHDTCPHTSCPNLVLRMSFECNSKQMDELAIRRRDYSWVLIIRRDPWECDDYSALHYEDYVQGGCRNPSVPPYIWVWTNCRVGNGL